jgi:hypothetical protein
MEQKELDKMDKDNKSNKSSKASSNEVRVSLSEAKDNKESKSHLSNKISLIDLLKSYEAKIDFSELEDNPIVTAPPIRRRKYIPDSR